MQFSRQVSALNEPQNPQQISTARKDSVSFFLPQIMNFKSSPLVEQVHVEDTEFFYKQLIDVQLQDSKFSGKDKIIMITAAQIHFIKLKKLLISKPTARSQTTRQAGALPLKTSSILRDPTEIHENLLKSMQNTMLQANILGGDAENYYLHCVKNQSIGQAKSLKKAENVTPQVLIFRAVANIILQSKLE
ncbi:hypothetical protein SS50377_27372 [Spironucleus salmonicida]|uniref:Uncharacterized protein n=1 Tax=Spironucleus salmonicida TaxID=348837 RepID=V6LHZ1_9EUKA|nr:hypothetical protein SS50377_27372 [Spironucleus salmonicida]|eukprot:EST43326.1 Hypothetical protein SS50377_17003 [Spironucleus salmonicida]